MARTKQAHFQSQVISKLLERLPALRPWEKDAHDWYTKPSGSEVKVGIWDRLEHLSRTKYGRAWRTEIEDACDIILEYLESSFPEELDDGLGDSDSDDDDETMIIKKKYLIQEVERKFPGVFGNRGLGDADPVNLLVNRIMNEGPNRPLKWIFSEIERALPDARKVAGAMYEIKDENAKLEQEIKKAEEECNFWRAQTLRRSEDKKILDSSESRLASRDDGGYVPEIRYAFEELPLPIRDGHV